MPNLIPNKVNPQKPTELQTMFIPIVPLRHAPEHKLPKTEFQFRPIMIIIY